MQLIDKFSKTLSGYQFILFFIIVNMLQHIKHLHEEIQLFTKVIKFTSSGYM